jgi:hypothetical protein
MKRIFWVLMTVVALILGGAWYFHRANTRAANSGDVSLPNASGNATDANATGEPVQPGKPTDAVKPPDGDSIQRNPPNGTVFAGTGKYQLYRQGDITWRLNTDNGSACILFATDSQWHKKNVYEHGCGVA